MLEYRARVPLLRASILQEPLIISKNVARSTAFSLINTYRSRIAYATSHRFQEMLSFAGEISWHTILISFFLALQHRLTPTLHFRIFLQAIRKRRRK